MFGGYKMYQTKFYYSNQTTKNYFRISIKNYKNNITKSNLVEKNNFKLLSTEATLKWWFTYKVVHTLHHTPIHTHTSKFRSIWPIIGHQLASISDAHP